MDFVIELPISTNWKGKTYDLIVVIVDWLIKIVYYEPIKITINAPTLSGVIIEVIMQQHGLPGSIVSD